jgi:hypothetical protein
MLKRTISNLLILIFAASAPLSAQSIVGTITGPTGVKLMSPELYAAGSKLFAVDSTNGRVLVYHSRTLALLGNIDFSGYAPYHPAYLAIDEGRGLLYVALVQSDLTGGSTIFVLDAGTHAVTATIPLAVAGPISGDFAHQRLYVWSDSPVTSAGDLMTSIDTATNTVVGSLDLYVLMGGGLSGGRSLNRQTGEWLVTNIHYDKFLVVNGPALTSQLYTVEGSRGWAGVWNTVENKIVITTVSWMGYFIYDRDTGSSMITSVFNDGTQLAYNPVTNRVFSSSEIAQNTTVIEGATDAARNIEMPSGALTEIGFVNGPRHVFFAGAKNAFVLGEKHLNLVQSFPDCGAGTAWDVIVDQANDRIFIFFYDSALNYILVFDDPTPPFEVTSPDGGEAWPDGSVHDITWKHPGAAANVKIEYSTDAGATWATIVASTPNDGSYSWTVPGTKSTTCLVRISDAADPAVNDTSDAVFSIPMTLAESLDATALTWMTGGDAPWFPQSWYRYSGSAAAQSGAIGDAQWSYLQTTVTGPGDLSFYWKVSSQAFFDVLTFWIDNEEYQSRSGEGGWSQVQASIPSGSHALSWTYEKDFFFNSNTDAGWVDLVVFTPTIITPALTVTSPNGGESWTIGSAHDITWTASGTVGNVKIESSTNGGAAWTTVIASTENDGLHAWTVPAPISA